MNAPGSAHGPRQARLLPLGEALVADNATLVGDVTLGAGASVWYGTVIRGDCAAIRIGPLTNVQDLTMVHADTGAPLEIGSAVTIGHGAVVHGRRVGDRCLIGIGAIVLGGSEIGEDCIIAAGALVKEGAVIPPRSLVAGVPGRVMRALRPDELAAAQARAEHYWELARSHVRRDVS